MKAKQLYLIKEAKSHVRMAGKVHVRGHRRRNGSYVKEHWRRLPNRKIGIHKRFESTADQLAIFETKADSKGSCADDLKRAQVTSS